MEKEFVKYTESLALKELGFDEPCFGNWQDMKEETPWFSKSYSDNQNQYYGQLCLAPTYSQAFRWFREKYDLDSFVKHLYKSKIKVGYYFGIDEYKGIDFQMYLDDYYKTYEEAELACLKQLIQIVKQK